MAAEPALILPLPDDSTPDRPETPVSFAELFVQDLPPLPSLAALRALTDRDLPSTDGLPMPDNSAQARPLRYTVEALEGVYRARRPGTFVTDDMLVYYFEERAEASGQVRIRSVAPDVLVAFGVGERDRDSYVTWHESKAPDFVMEIASKSTWRRDVEVKPAIYAGLGVKEYFLYDPEGGRLEPRIQGYALEAGRYRRLRGERLGNGEWGVCSPVLGLCLWLKGRGGMLRWYDPVAGEDLKTHSEDRAGRIAETAARKVAENRARMAEDRAAAQIAAREAAEDDARTARDRAAAEATARKAAEDRARTAEDHAAAETAAREATEAENAGLRAQLRRLQRGSGVQ